MTVDDWQAIDATLAAEWPAVGDVLAALALTGELRADLDRAERRLIGLARECGTSWHEIATALGLRTRQAAEQRWLRLSGTGTGAAGRDATEARRARGRQRSVDSAAGEEIIALRATVAALYDYIDRSPSLALPRRTLQAALPAAPGALVDLAKLAANDLSEVPGRELGRPAADALERVRALLGQIGPG